MKRDLTRLANERFDVVIVGGGIFGAACAWEAVSRGLSVALVEAVDFGHATSANCFKVIHGGVRYMQHGDIARVRSSVYERSTLLRIAPHLAKPLPIVIPTYGHGRQGKAFLTAGMTAYDLVTADRNRHIHDPKRQIPGHQLLGRAEVKESYPWLGGQQANEPPCTGGVLFYDGQMYSPERLVLAFVRSAAEAGAAVANHLRATSFVTRDNRVVGLSVHDTITDQDFEIEGDITINAAGPWAEKLLEDSSHQLKLDRRSTFSRDAWFLLRRPWVSTDALALQARNKDPDALLSRSARHLFVVPWRGLTIVGVWHKVTDVSANDVDVPESDLQAFVDEVNWACPELDIKMDEVGAWNAGLVLFGDEQKSTENQSYGKRSRVVDHEQLSGIRGLVTLIGVRYTTARGEARRLLDLVARKLDRKIGPSVSDRQALFGGNIDSVDELSRTVCARLGAAEGDPTVRALCSFHGDNYSSVLDLLDDGKYIPDSHVLEAEVRYACREEMAVCLVDVVMRRTELLDGCHPGDNAIAATANIMQRELQWTDARRAAEIAATNRELAHRRYRKLN